jgi:phage tail tape-measure protein
MMAAAGVTGAIAGAATGAIAGPPGAIAGGVIGGAVGLLTGDVFDKEEARHEQHEAELDEEIGVTGPDLGVEEKRKSVPPDMEPSVDEWNT